VTFAEPRDRRKIYDIEAYTRQPFKAEVVPGLEPQQRAPQGGRPGGDFAGRGRGAPPRDRNFGGGGQRSGGFGGGFSAPREDRGFDQRRGGNEGFAPRKPGFGDFGNRTTTESFAGRHGDGFGQRNDFAPRGDFAPRKPAFDKAARPGNGGKVFVPRDAAKKRAYKPGN
jgi:hypothetical protein